MLALRYAPLLALSLLACSPDPAVSQLTDTTSATSTGDDTTAAPVTSTADLSTGPSTDPGPVSTSDATSTSGGPALTSTGPELTTGDSTGTSTGTTTTGTTGDETTDSSSTGVPSEDEYAAFYVPGGLDRIVVRKADFDDDRCTDIVFVLPGEAGQPDLDIALPEGWGVQWAEVHQGAADCLVFMGQLGGGVAADAASGSATWAARPFCPQTLDLEISLAFPPDEAWVPADDLLSATAIPVQGC